MAISNFSAAQTPLLDDTVDAFLDHRGRPVRGSNSSGWGSTCFIIAMEIAERFAYYGMNLFKPHNLLDGASGRVNCHRRRTSQHLVWGGVASITLGCIRC